MYERGVENGPILYDATWVRTGLRHGSLSALQPKHVDFPVPFEKTPAIMVALRKFKIKNRVNPRIQAEWCVTKFGVYIMGGALPNTELEQLEYQILVVGQVVPK